MPKLRLSRRSALGLAPAYAAVAALFTIASPNASAQTAQAVTLRFAAEFDGKPFDCSATIAGVGVGKSTVTPIDFRLYVSNIQLVRADGALVPLALEQDGKWQHRDLALLDFEDGAGKCNTGTPDTRGEVTGRVPPGDYVGLRFSLGVPFSENHKNAALAPAPLAQSALSWNWQQGYIFLRFEGGTPAGRYEVHLGSTGCTGTTGNITACARPNRPVVELPAFDAATQTVIFDVKQLLAGSDITSNAGDSIGCASAATDEDCAGPFAQFGLDLQSGAMTGEQDVFRAE